MGRDPEGIVAAAPDRIRRARVADLAAVGRLERLSFDPPWNAQLLAGDLEHRDSLLLVAEESAGRVVGYALFRRMADEGELLRLAVDAEHRRRGIAARLQAEGLRHLQRLGVRTVYLEVRSDNQEAIRLYEREGWCRSGRRRRYYRDGADAWIYRLSL